MQFFIFMFQFEKMKKNYSYFFSLHHDIGNPIGVRVWGEITVTSSNNATIHPVTYKSHAAVVGPGEVRNRCVSVVD